MADREFGVLTDAPSCCPLACVTYYLLAFWGAALVCFALTPLVRRLAIARGVLDRPDPRKIHLGAVPRWGGAAVWIAVALAIAAVFVASPTLRSVLSGSAARWAALALGCCAILAAGMVYGGFLVSKEPATAADAGPAV